MRYTILVFERLTDWILRHADLHTFRKSLLPPYSESKKSKNNSSWISWTLKVFNETWIFINVSLRARSFARGNITLVLIKAIPILKEALIVLSSLRENIFEIFVDRNYSIRLPCCGRYLLGGKGLIRNFQTWTFALRSQLKIQVFFPHVFLRC